MSGKPTNETKIKCAIYARSATDNTNSIERQLQACRKYIAKQANWTLSEIFVDCPASGRSADRPHLRALLQTMRMKPSPFNHLVIEESSRLGRDLNLVAEILTSCESSSVSLHLAAAGTELSLSVLNRAFTLETKPLAALGGPRRRRSPVTLIFRDWRIPKQTARELIRGGLARLIANKVVQELAPNHRTISKKNPR